MAYVDAVGLIPRQPQIDKTVGLGRHRLVQYGVAIRIGDVHLEFLLHQLTLAAG
ncbi:hypothetical protein D3C76_1003880 [compost metagenome]